MAGKKGPELGASFLYASIMQVPIVQVPIGSRSLSSGDTKIAKALRASRSGISGLWAGRKGDIAAPSRFSSVQGRRMDVIDPIANVEVGEWSEIFGFLDPQTNLRLQSKHGYLERYWQGQGTMCLGTSWE
jgi:hypothetical protein